MTSSPNYDVIVVFLTLANSFKILFLFVRIVSRFLSIWLLRSRTYFRLRSTNFVVTSGHMAISGLSIKRPKLNGNSWSKNFHNMISICVFFTNSRLRINPKSHSIDDHNRIPKFFLRRQSGKNILIFSEFLKLKSHEKKSWKIFNRVLT